MSSRVSNAPESILPKKGRLPISLAQLQALRLKQELPSGTKVAIIFRADGNVEVGVIQTAPPMTTVNDVAKVQVARTLAHRVLNKEKKTEVEAMASTVTAAIVGKVPVAEVQPSPQYLQEARRVRLENERIKANQALFERFVPSSTNPLETLCHDYLKSCARTAVAVLADHLKRNLMDGSKPKETLAFPLALMRAGVPKWVYARLIQANLITSAEPRYYEILFGTKISKSLKLTYEELNSECFNEKLKHLIDPRNQYSICAARSPELYDLMKQDLDENGQKRLRKIQLTMVGPGNHCREWAVAQPTAPVPVGSIGEPLLQINAAEINYASGVLPLMYRAIRYWSKAVKVGKDYVGSPQEIVMAAIEDAKSAVGEEKTGFVLFPRDTNGTIRDLLPPKLVGFSAPDKAVGAGFEFTNPARVIPPPSGMPEPKHFLDSEEGKVWHAALSKKLFLKTASDGEKPKKASSAPARTPLPPHVFQTLMQMQLAASLRNQIVTFLMQFQSVPLLEQAFNVFRAEMQKMDVERSYLAPEPIVGENPFSQEEEDDDILS